MPRSEPVAATDRRSANEQGEQAELARRFAELSRNQAPRLPLPGGGRTRQRWQLLAEVAEDDLGLAKLFESHTDALAILAELDRPDRFDADASWAVWAAEPPDARVRVTGSGDGAALTGRKAWCSGARLVSHGLLTAWNDDGRQQLVAVDLAAPGVTIVDDAWQAVGMGQVGTPDLVFDSVPAALVGSPGEYTERPGFWHGGCGIAACWYGGAVRLARAVREAAARRSEPHRDAHLGAIDVALRSVRALLIETAGWIDDDPRRSAFEPALRLRAAADATAGLVLEHAGRALGAGPLCRDRSVARHAADLPVFVRQTHAERDLAELGTLVAADDGWHL